MKWVFYITILALVIVAAFQHKQHWDQARRLRDIDRQLQQDRVQFAARQTSLSEMEQETQVLLAEKQKRNEAATNLLARQRAELEEEARISAAARKSPEPPQQSAAVGAALLTDDPSMREYVHLTQLNLSRELYAPLFRDLKLSSDQIDSFASSRAAMMLKVTDAMAMTARGSASGEDAQRAATDAYNEWRSQLQSLLGESGYATLQDFEQAMPAQTTLRTMQQQLATSPLSAEQNDRLTQIILAEPRNLTDDLANTTDVAIAGTTMAIDDHVVRMMLSHQHILQQAADFLTPDQLHALGSTLADGIARTRARAALARPK